MIKKALLVGINAYPKSPLRGCLNDVAQMEDLLLKTYGFPQENIRVIRDGDATGARIESELLWLAEGGPGSDAGDIRVFHYSGHGTQVADTNGDEPEGADEAICPVDYDTKGFFIDDKLGALYDKVPSGSNLTILMDCCHSGTIQRDPTKDIVYRVIRPSPEMMDQIEIAREQFEAKQDQYIFERIRGLRDLSDEELKKKIQALTRSFRVRQSRFGDVTNREGNVLFAGCKSIQTSADAYIGGDYHGAFTYYFVEAIKKLGANATCRQIAAETGNALKANHYEQVPQLEGKVINKDRPLFAPFGAQASM